MLLVLLRAAGATVVSTETPAVLSRELCKVPHLEISLYMSDTGPPHAHSFEYSP